MENKVTIEQLLEDIESNRNTLQTDKLDMSFGEIMSMYERDEIIINPNFQRLYRWSDEQKTRFMESIIMGIPIPPIFVAEDKNGRWELVDGLQRISTVLSFFGLLKTMPEKNDWVLDDADLIKSLNGFKCKELPLKIQLNIKRASCRIEIIKWNSEYDLRFELFNRLNTGGSPLTNQEIRNCLFRGISSQFNDYLKELASNKQFRRLVNLPQQRIDELYLEELVLRFITLYSEEIQLNKSIAQLMTDFMYYAVKKENFAYPKYRSIFETTVNILSKIGPEAFCSANNEFSTAMYDTIMIGIAKNIQIYSGQKGTVIKDIISKVRSNDIYRKLTRSGGNNSVQRVQRRLQYAKELFGKS